MSDGKSYRWTSLFVNQSESEVFTIKQRHSGQVLTHQGEGHGAGGHGTFGFVVVGRTRVLAGLPPKAMRSDHVQGQVGAGVLHGLPVVEPAEGGGRAGDGGTRQAEVGVGVDEFRMVHRSDGDFVGAVCGGRRRDEERSRPFERPEPLPPGLGSKSRLTSSELRRENLESSQYC